jgi:hypothetical protein
LANNRRNFVKELLLIGAGLERELAEQRARPLGRGRLERNLQKVEQLTERAVDSLEIEAS